MISVKKNATSLSLTTAWVTMLVLIGVQMLNTLNFINITLDSFTVGLLLLASGAICFAESAFESSTGKLSFSAMGQNASDALGVVLGIVSWLLVYGTLASNAWILDHFGSFSGGLFVVLFVYIVYEGLFNRT